MKEKFWQYLKDNHIWLLLGFTILMGCFFAYWVYSSGLEEAKSDIVWGCVVLGVVWIAILIGDFINWKKL